MSPGDLFLCGILLLHLDSPVFATRINAERSLDAMGQRAVPMMATVKQHAALNTRIRLSRLLARRQTEWDEAEWRALLNRKEPMPWLDSLPDNYPDRWETISYFVWGKGKADHGQTQKNWTSYRNATVGWLLSMKEEGIRPKEALKLVERMDKRCRGWSGAGLPPPE